MVKRQERRALSKEVISMDFCNAVEKVEPDGTLFWTISGINKLLDGRQAHAGRGLKVNLLDQDTAYSEYAPHELNQR